MKALYQCYMLKQSVAGQSVHPNRHGTHCTIAFGAGQETHPQEGEEIHLLITGELITEKVQCYIVDPACYIGKNRFPHITLSCAEGVKPFESNSEIEKFFDLVKWLPEPTKVNTVITTVFANNK